MKNLIHITVKDIVSNTETNVEGVKLYCIIEKTIKDNSTIILEIENDMILSSSFLNSSLGSILDNYGFNNLKNNLKLKCNKYQFQRINTYLNKYKELYQN